MQLFYHPTLTEKDSIILFDKDESKHIVKVLRHKRGDILLTTNGLGNIFEIELMDVTPKYASGKVIRCDWQKPLSYNLHIAIAPTKSNDRLEWFLEKATELGVRKITPIVCDHSERSIVKHDRLLKIVESAMKQSMSAYLPILDKPMSFDAFLEDSKDANGLKCIAHCQEGIKASFFERIQKASDVLVMIGPEGDFSSLEIKKALIAGFEAITLGSRRLRTETAGIYACAQVAAVNNI